MEAFVFPGQGSQRVGMGSGLFDKVREFAALEPQIDAILGYSLRELCLKDPERRLSITAYTQPALFVVNALHYLDAVAEGAKPALVAGHSLGEFNALHAAGVFDLLTGVRLVHKRGELMNRASGGGMAAVIGLDVEQVREVLRASNLIGIDLANCNSRAQTVLSGLTDDIKKARAVFEQAGAEAFVPLPVSAAFHSRYMRPAALEYESFLRAFEFSPPRIPVVSNVTARPYGTINPNDSTRGALVRQITSPVQWTRSVLYLLDRGVDRFRELGPGQVLTRLIQQIESPPVANA